MILALLYTGVSGNRGHLEKGAKDTKIKIEDVKKDVQTLSTKLETSVGVPIEDFVRLKAKVDNYDEHSRPLLDANIEAKRQSESG